LLSSAGRVLVFFLRAFLGRCIDLRDVTVHPCRFLGDLATATVAHAPHRSGSRPCQSQPVSTQAPGPALSLKRPVAKRRHRRVGCFCHLPAQPRKNKVQAMRRYEHLRAQPRKAHVQAVRRIRHLRAQPPKGQVLGLPAEGGLVLGRRTEER
jgi:hypothetical protein